MSNSRKPGGKLLLIGIFSLIVGITNNNMNSAILIGILFIILGILGLKYF